MRTQLVTYSIPGVNDLFSILKCFNADHTNLEPINANVNTRTAEYSRFLCPHIISTKHCAYFKLGKLFIHLFSFCKFKLCIFHQRGKAEIPFAYIYSNLSE